MKQSALCLLVFLIVVQPCFAQELLTEYSREFGTTHVGKILSAIFSPDEKTIISSGGDTTVMFWDVQSGEPIQTWYMHSDWVRALALSPDGTMLATGSDDRTVNVLNLQTGDVLYHFDGYLGYVYSVAFSPDSTKLMCCDGHRVEIWDLIYDELYLSFDSQKGGNAIRVGFTPDGNQVVLGGSTATHVVDLDSEEVIQTFEGGAGILSPDGTRLLTYDQDYQITLWNFESGASIRTVSAHSKNITALAFSPDSTRMASSSFDGTANVWDVQTGRLLRNIAGHENEVRSIAFSADGNRVLTTSTDETIQVWDIETGESLLMLGGPKNMAWSVTFSPDGATVTAGTMGGYVKHWDTQTGHVTGMFPAHSDIIRSIAYSPGGAYLATRSFDDGIKIWRTSNWSQVTAYASASSSREPHSMAFSPDETSLLVGQADGTAVLLDSVSGTIVQTYAGHKGEVITVGFLANGSKVLTASKGNPIKLFDRASGQEIGTLAAELGSTLNMVNVSRDEQRILTGHTDSTLRVWDSTTGELLGSVSDPYGARSTVGDFSANGLYVLSGDKRFSEAKLWDLGRNQVLYRIDVYNQVFQYSSKPFMQVFAFSPKGDLMMTVGYNHNIRLWDLSGRIQTDVSTWLRY